MSITPRINRLIEESAALNARIAGRLEKSGLAFLIWASPSACRSPEGSKIWHPFYAGKPVIIKLLIYFYIIGLYLLVGIVSFFTYRGFYYNYIEAGSSVLLVIPEEITDHSSQAKTDYLTEEVDYPVDRLVFSQIKNIGESFTALNHFTKARITLTLFTALMSDLWQRLICMKINTDYLDTFVIFIRWVISHSWSFNWDFYHLLKEKLDSNLRYKVLLSLHEMHFYSKVIWKVASEGGKIGVTAQHAVIIPEKLWYFPHASELEANCPEPDVFFVYSDEIKKLLEPFYPRTRFYLCCSPRFSKWKTVKTAQPSPQSKDVRRYVTFVSGIPYYDSAILVMAMKNLLKSKGDGDIKIKVRLHPHAIVRSRDKLWLEDSFRSSRIFTSNASLKEDLFNSCLVIGANSTVLQEAILMGIPALSISTSEYVHPSILPDTADWRIAVENISWKGIEQWTTRIPENSLIDRFKANMGIYSPDLTTGLVYGVVSR